MKGWIKSIRQSKGIQFIAITDGTKDHQLTLHDDKCEVVGELKVGASVCAEGVFGKTPRGFDEFVTSKLIVVGNSDDDFPIQPKAHGFDFLRSVPEQRGRTKTFRAIWKIRHRLTQAIHSVLDKEGFIQYYTPIITSSDCEGAGEVFEVKSDWLTAGLTVSGQLHGEVGMMSLGKIYTFSPCFRAEKSTTRKHLSEFWMIEPEIAFCDKEQTISFVEIFIKKVLQQIIDECKSEFKDLEIDTSHVEKVIQQKWLSIPYVEIISKYGVEHGEDIGSEIEKKIIDDYQYPVFITDYPESLKPFYMKMKDGYAQCFDLIFPEVGELVGGSQREEDYGILQSQMIKGGLDMEKMDWYLQTRKWGTVPHSGFGIGFERLLMFVTKVPKVHDVIPYPVAF